jgi:choline dehydrogenase-like flavoprotein
MLCEGLWQLGKLLFAGGAEEIYQPVPGGPPIRSPKDIDFLRRGVPQGRLNVSTIHLFSSCPMGEDTDTCAVDSFGRYHGLGNVWVNDASMLPHSPGVNPQGTILAIARRNVTRFLETQRRT